MNNQQPLRADLGSEFSAVSKALQTLGYAKTNVGIGSSAAKGYDQAIQVLESNQSLDDKVYGLTEELVRQGTKLDDTEKARNFSNLVAVLAVAATLISGIPAFLPYFGMQPKSPADQQLTAILREFQRTLSLTTEAMEGCSQKLQAPSLSPEKRSK
jgi:hypothetical protein